jgi:hypothetical protein
LLLVAILLFRQHFDVGRQQLSKPFRRTLESAPGYQLDDSKLDPSRSTLGGDPVRKHVKERIGAHHDVAIVSEVGAERERADDLNRAVAEFGDDSVTARAEESLGLSIEQHAVERAQAPRLPANLGVDEDAPLRFECHSPDVVKAPVAGVLP